MYGFLLTCAAFAVIAVAFNTPLRTASSGAGFVLFYGLTYFFTNAGPNSTTFLIPTESFPTLARATAHGISAAMGKLGATAGSFWLLDLFYSFCVSQRDASGAPNCSAASAPTAGQQNEMDRGVIAVMATCAVVAAVGATITYFFTIETKGLSLDDVDKMSPPKNPRDFADIARSSNDANRDGDATSAGVAEWTHNVATHNNKSSSGGFKYGVLTALLR
jgi:PHS family inorganic phosphate transporter-like MFS transporter